MIKINDKINEVISPFIIIAICYICSIFSIRLIDILFMGGVSEISSFSGLIYGNLTGACFIVFCVFIIYLIVYKFSNKSAPFTAALLLNIMTITEAGLMFYHKSTGILMGNELINRPLWETLFTIKTVLNIWIVIGALALIAFLIFISLRLSKKRLNPITIYVTLLLIAASAPLFFLTKPIQDKYIVNKISYCIHSCFLDNENNNFNTNKIEYDEDQIENYKQIYPERKVYDYKYPLERKDNTENVLGPFFEKSNKKPNIVVIIVESLDYNLFGQNEYGYTFTPFLDSLSKHSLLWTNCLSTTPRSFGAVPAITGSVPHGFMGFQFGDMPEYNSLFSVLKNNNYATNAFYAGEFSFDKVYDYLVTQKIDYLSPFYQEFTKKESKKFDHTYWGWHDKVMFDKSMEVIEQRDKTKSNLDLFITISQHDNKLKLNNKEETDSYYNKAEEIISTLPEEEQIKKNEIIGFLAATLYSDKSIEHFFKRYNDFYDDENTIFIITGDHSLNLNPYNPLDSFHVPLIIWSPMLKKAQHFKSAVSHNDIVPTINALLRDNFNMKTPNKIHWMGGELDTISEFHCDLKTTFLRYTRKVFDCIYGNYYYLDMDNLPRVYLVKDNLELEKINDKELVEKVGKDFETIVYIDNYAYLNDRVTKDPLYPQSKFNVIKEFVVDSAYCASLSVKPSVKKPVNTNILSTEFKNKCKEVKVVVTADVIYTGEVTQSRFISLCMDYACNKNSVISHSEYISKLLTVKDYKPNEWVKMEFIKTISVKDLKESNLDIYLKPTHTDGYWNPDHTITLKNINVSILGSN